MTRTEREYRLWLNESAKRQPGSLSAYLAGYRKALELAAHDFSKEYSEALREGCDHDAAKDCGLEAIRKLEE